MKKFLLLPLLLGGIVMLFAQPVQVQTIIESINASGGLSRDAAGNIYVSDYGPGSTVDSNTRVYRIEKDDFTLSTFAEGFIGASGAYFDSEGNFYQSNNNGNRITKIHADGTVEYDWATETLNLPIGLAGDAENNIYVCNCGGNNISRITPNGDETVFASSSLFNCPNGLTIDPDGNLYACNFSDGKVLKITSDGTVTKLAELPVLTGGPNPVGNGHLTYSNGYLYVSLIGRGQIYRLCLSGEAEVIAGQAFGFSNNDGPGMEATFSKPNGIVASITGDTLFVNGSHPTWPTDPQGLHPANLRMITGLNSLDDELCEQSAGPTIFDQLTEGVVVNTALPTLGSSWGDFNKDGHVDLFISVGGVNNRLYKNNGGLSFSLVEGDISSDGGVSSSAVWGDYNNDGYLDLYVSNNPNLPSAPQSNFLYQNDGPPDFTFTRITTEPPATVSNYTWSSTWVDYDNDGDLDLHVPDNKHEEVDYFFENKGAPDATGQYFSDLQPSFVTGNVESTGVASWVDYDNDCDLDLFMIKSGRTHPQGGEDNRMYHNVLQETGNLEFQQVFSADMVNHFDLDFQASWGDYDNDGDLDVYLGNFDDSNYLYRNEGDSLFTRITEGSLVEDDTPTLGSSWGDYDNDGDLDLFVSNSGGVPCAYYQNQGDGTFARQYGDVVGPPVTNLGNILSTSNADINNDGYLDLFVATLSNDLLYLNNGGENNHLLLSLEGTISNRAAIGAKVWVKANIEGADTWQMRYISGSITGDRAQNSLRTHFGLGDAELIDSLIIEWPSCQRDVYVNVAINQVCSIDEDGMTNCELESGTNSKDRRSGLNQFVISPNPASGDVVMLHYEVDNVKELTFLLLDINGQLIRQRRTLNTGTFELSTEGLSAGVYVVKLQAGRNVRTQKLVVD